VLITAPARDKGTVTLKRQKEVWNYIPKIQRTVKIPPSMMLQAWMGSDFSNDDLVRQSSLVEDYTHRLDGNEVIAGYECFKIEMIPKPEAGVVWGKLITWISRKGDLMLLTHYFDEDGNLIRIMSGSEVKSLGGRTFPTRWEIKPLDNPARRTILIYDDIQFNARLDADFFSQQNMSRIR
jgi:outer membrane lipoprotein-sorting protein